MSTLQINTQKNNRSGNEVQVSDNNLIEWVFERVRAYVAGSVLEIDNSKGFLAAVCIQNNLLTKVLSVNLLDPFFDTSYADLLGCFDTVIGLYIGEQMVSNPLVVTNCTKLLKQNGHLITRLPAQTALYNGLNQGVDYWEMYNLEFINKVLRKDCSIVKIRYFIAGKDMPSHKWLSKYNERVTLFNWNNASELNQIGLSILVVGRKR